MSGMFDKKTEKTKRKQELTQKEQKARRKRSIITGCVVTVFLLAVCAAVLLNSNWLRRTVPVLTVGGVDFNTAQFEYFYNTEYMNYAQEMQSQGWSFMLPDSSRPLSSQIYNSQTGETWADFFITLAIGSMREIATLNTLAKADGFVLSEEDLADVEYAMWMNEYQALMSGFPNVDSYIQRVYGDAINEAILRDILEMITMAEAYVRHMRSSFSYTQDEIRAHYAENSDIYDIFSYRYFTVEADGFIEFEDGGDEESYEAASEAAAEAARLAAEAYIAGTENEEDFIANARDYDEYLYEDEKSTLREVQGHVLDDAGNIDSYFAEWLRDSSRAGGDTAVIDVPGGAAALYFIGRDDNSYNTAGMRQILILRQSVSVSDYPEGEDDPDYIAALEEAAGEARERALLVDGLFDEAGRTEQALIDLMEEHSDDTTEGGYYDNITKYPYQGGDVYAMKVVPELEDWLFEAGRAVGDSKLIETEAYGFHLLYFTGFGDVFADILAQDRLRAEDLVKWLDEIPEAETVRRGAFILVTT